MSERDIRSETILKRLGLDGLVSRVRDLEVPDDALTWTRFLGALLLVLVVLLCVSGVFMTFSYSPAPGIAYDSVDFAQFQLPFGGIVRGVHCYAWNLLLVVMGLHLARAFLVGAYKAPGEFVWVSGVVILLVVPGFIVTGDLLPWDQKGYWSTQVRNSITASVPLAGDFLVRVLQGGPRTGIVALTRFYVLHVMVLPAVLVVLVVFHLNVLRHRGLSGPVSGDRQPPKTVSLVPTMLNRWLLLFLVVSVVLGLLAWYRPAPLGDPADPTDISFVPKPEWWVLAINQLVAIFRGPFTVMATTIIPGGLLVLLMALPFLDRSPERRPAYRKRAMLVGAIVAVIFLALSVMGYVEHHLISPP